jgi:flagellar basal body rod protein FlgC
VSDFGVMQYAAAGMEAQRSALDVLARNLALVQSADAKHPVHTLVPQFATVPGSEDDFAASLAAFDPADGDLAEDGDDDNSAGVPASIEMASLGDDAAASDDVPNALPGQIEFAGVRPSANAVTGVDAVSEMVGVLGAQRAFEASASVFDTGKRLIEKTINVEQQS